MVSPNHPWFTMAAKLGIMALESADSTVPARAVDRPELTTYPAVTEEM